MEMRLWDHCVEEALSNLKSLKLIRSLKPIHLPSDERRRSVKTEQEFGLISYEFEVFEGLPEWDRASVEVEVAENTFLRWVRGVPSSGDDADCGNQEVGNEAGACSHQKLESYFFLFLFFAALAHGMGPRGSALICGYTNYHRLLESCLAYLKSKEAMVSTRGALLRFFLCKAGTLDMQAALMGILQRPTEEFKIKRLRCPMKKKVVVTDSLFSMDGDFAPMGELSKLPKRHGFLLVIDDAHGMFVCGKNGGGLAEELNCKSGVDICVDTLSKAAGLPRWIHSMQVPFWGCSILNKRWKQLIQSTGRSFIFSTSTPVPIAAAAHAAVIAAQKETWRRRAIWKRVQDFHALTGIPVTSPIISLVLLLKSGYQVTAIRPPPVPPNSCRLRVTLSAAHTLDDLKKLTAALSECINFRDIIAHSTNEHTRL
ncbi:hypothetical protein RHSIM_Rhsim03G0164600 [Rhododendron simsii]|uniref:Aminotransferase class I/classII large domain-containing protein n=1 Tax=Rhododendron simsii TaxID=118357 RepID=A0A834H4A1_RHOSS|nr:hypothetical protein RHSIM_Rhsim03G0164600 [Rhododendron simsii]